MVEVYSEHVNLTTEFSRSSRRRRIRQILSLLAIFSSELSGDHPFRLVTIPTGASEVPLSVKANHMPFRQTMHCHVLLFFSACELTCQRVWITVSTHASYLGLTIRRRASLDYSHPCRRRKVVLLPLFSLRQP